MRINAHVTSVRSARPDYPYGQTARVPISNAVSCGLVRAPIPVDIPTDAVIEQADLVFYIRGAITGSRTFLTRLHTESWESSTATWTDRPAIDTSTVHSTTVGAVPDLTEVRVSVTADVEAFLAGTFTNRGWRLSHDDATEVAIYGSTADVGQPWLDLDFLEPGEAPIDLTPDGAAVSIGKPVVRAVSVDDVIAVQVQADAAADWVTPDFDSGEVPASRAELDLSATTFAAPADGTNMSWRIRVKSSLGWSPWSLAATYSRDIKPNPSIIAPDATTGDKTPTLVWASASQKSWRARFYNALTGKVWADSGKVTSNATSWTPGAGFTREDQQGEFELRVWDDVDRVATPGDPVYGVETVTTTLVAENADPGLAYLNASQVGFAPQIRLSFPASSYSGGLQVVRNGKWIDRIDADRTHWTDYGVTPGKEYEYRVLPVFSDISPDPPFNPVITVSRHGPRARVDLPPSGLWLFDPDTEQYVLLVEESFDGTASERYVVHDLLTGAPVRRRSGQPPAKGTVSGTMLDDPRGQMPLDDMLDVLADFKGSGSQREYRLVYSGWNKPVTIADLSWVPMNLDNLVGYRVSFSWWQTDAELDWDE